MRIFFVAVAAALCLAFAASPALAQKLEGEAKKQAEQALEELLLQKQVTAKVNFPAYKNGIDLKADTGEWHMRLTDRWIKSWGLGVATGETAMVTKVVLKGKHIEIHLNGGGRGTMSDFVSDLNRAQIADMSGNDPTTRGAAEGVEGLRQPGGSRINLRFDRDITAADLEPEKLMNYLSPLVDASSLRQDVFAANIPEEFREAAERGEVVAGMDKQTVFAVLGEPADRSMDLSTNPPTEKWQYNRDDLTVLLVTFEGGKVSSVEVF